MSAIPEAALHLAWVRRTKTYTAKKVLLQIELGYAARLENLENLGTTKCQLHASFCEWIQGAEMTYLDSLSNDL